MSNLLEALKQIDVSQLSYDEWISVGMALKAEGYDCSVWDEWSQNDTRYKKGGAILIFCSWCMFHCFSIQ